jgi:hypothetical protein
MHAPSDGPTAYQRAVAAVALASRPDTRDDPALLAALVAGLGLAGGVRLVDRALPHATQDVLGHLFSGGWQPVDLVRMARREHGDQVAAVMVDMIAGRMREYPASTVDPRWAAQLRQLGAEVWWASDATWADAWAERHGAGRLEMITVAIHALRLVRALPSLPVLIPPPGHARPDADPRPRGGARPDADPRPRGGARPDADPRPRGGARPDADPRPRGGARPAPAPRPAPESRRTLDRIRALLAKAESTTFPEEAETYTAKAQELMARHSIDAALLDASAPTRAEPVAVRIGLDAPYEGPKCMLLSVVAEANRCRSVWSKQLGFSTVFGFETDLELVELLYTSLLVQATAAMTAQGPRRDRHGRSSTRSFRQSFLAAYANRIGERLSGAAERAGAEAAADVGGSALLPVLAAREEAVRERVEAVFPTLRNQQMSIRNRDGWESGRAAADRASLQPRREVATRS